MVHGFRVFAPSVVGEMGTLCSRPRRHRHRRRRRHRQRYWTHFLIRQRLYVPDDATRTAANLIAHEGLARLGIVADLAMALTQAVTAVWFWKLFRPIRPVAAGSIAAFGLVNAVTILVGTMCSATALDVALRGTAASADEALLLYDLNAAAGNLGGLLFKAAGDIEAN